MILRPIAVLRQRAYLPRTTTTGGLLVVSIVSCHLYSQQDDETREGHGRYGTPVQLLSSLWSSCTRCDEAAAVSRSTSSAAASPQAIVVKPPSWWRRALLSLGWRNTSFPRRVQSYDPALNVPPALLKRRQRDEVRLRQLQRELERRLNESQKLSGDRMQQWLGEWATKQYEILYGPGMTPAKRHDFLVRYGCTAWTTAVLQRLVELGGERGYVEIGAGHGQWARALTDAHRSTITTTAKKPNQQQQREFVLAYDDASHLPLNPKVYHERTQPYRAYFFHNVQPCGSHPSHVLNQWITRHRILLLVYPTPDFAGPALQAYSAMGGGNDTVVYVGEGRGGANAGPDFFDFLEQSQWMLLDIMDVRPFGSKGYEQLFLFQKQKTMEKGTPQTSLSHEAAPH